MEGLVELLKKQPYIGCGSYQNVYDFGEFVIKTPIDYQESDKVNIRMRRAISVYNVKRMNKMRKVLGDVIPPAWYIYGGFMGQKKIDGKQYHELEGEARNKASKAMSDIYNLSYTTWPDDNFDSNTENYFFSDDGTLLAWVDPFTPKTRKLCIKKGPYGEQLR